MGVYFHTLRRLTQVTTNLGNKELLRRHFFEVRKNITPSRRAEATASVVSELLMLLNTKNKILSFSSFRGEIDLWKFNETLADKNQLLLPRVVGKDLRIYAVSNYNGPHF